MPVELFSESLLGDKRVDRIAIVGTGRLGTCLAVALSRAGYHLWAVAGRREEAAAALAARIPGCLPLSPQAAVEADLVFLVVPDDAIGPVAASLHWRAGQAVVHCSGATEVSVLAPAAQSGAMTGGFHPLQIFSDPERAVDLIAGSSVAIEGPPPLEARLRQIASRLGMDCIVLPPGARARYHGGASFAASFLLSMLHEAAAVWASFGVDEASALKALLPLARGTLDAAQAKGIAPAQAGPVSRGDAGVVRRHIEAMQALGGEHADFYREITRRQIGLAAMNGRLDAAALQALRDAVDL